MTVGLLRKAMEASGKSRFLIDGFPRNPENLAAWEASAAAGPPVIFDFALFLDCPEEVKVYFMFVLRMARRSSHGRIGFEFENLVLRCCVSISEWAVLLVPNAGEAVILFLPACCSTSLLLLLLRSCVAGLPLFS